MDYNQILVASDVQIIEMMCSQFGPIHDMRRVIRWGSPKLSSLPNQSVTEHTCNCMSLAEFFWYIEGKSMGIDLHAVWHMLLYHDLPETGEIGDVLQSMKPDFEDPTPDSELCKLLSGMHPTMAQSIREQLGHFEKQDTISAQFALAVEKLEASVENIVCGVQRLATVPQDSLREEMWHCWVLETRQLVTKPFPAMRAINDAMDRNILHRLEQYRPVRAAE